MPARICSKTTTQIPITDFGSTKYHLHNDRLHHNDFYLKNYLYVEQMSLVYSFTLRINPLTLTAIPLPSALLFTGIAGIRATGASTAVYRHMVWQGDGKEDELLARYTAVGDEDMGAPGKRKGHEGEGENRKKDSPGVAKEKEGQGSSSHNNAPGTGGKGKSRGKGKGKTPAEQKAEQKAPSEGIWDCIQTQGRLLQRVLQNQREEYKIRQFVLEITTPTFKELLAGASRHWSATRPSTGSHPDGPFPDVLWRVYSKKLHEVVMSEQISTEQKESAETIKQWIRRSERAEQSSTGAHSIIVLFSPLGKKNVIPGGTWLWVLRSDPTTSQGRDWHEWTSDNLGRLGTADVTVRHDRGNIDSLERRLAEQLRI